MILKLNINNRWFLVLGLTTALFINNLFTLPKEHIVKKGESLYQLSKKYNISVDELKKLNKLKSDNLKLGQSLILSKKENSNIDNKKKKNNTNSEKQYHTVKSGDNLYNISKQYDLTLDQLKALNNLSDNRLNVGQKLIVSEQNTSRSNNNQIASEPIESNASQNQSQDIIHKVKKGETLSHIAKKYKMDQATIKALNNLNSSKLKVGQKLIISKSTSRTQTSVSTTSSQTTDDYKIHVVNRNETLSQIAKKYKMSQSQLMELNKLKSKRLKRGQKLKVFDNISTSINTAVYSTQRNEPVRLQENFVVVKKGQTLYNIAKTYGIDIVDLLDYNNLKGFAIKEGQKIWLEPGHQSSPSINEEIEEIQKPQNQPIQTVPVHIVSRGENLFRIAKNYNVSVDDLKKWNNMTTLTVKEGQRVYIGDPAGMQVQQDIEFMKPNRQIIKPYSKTPILPLSTAKVISNFGMRSGRMHKGIDLVAPTGEPIYAVLPGRVVFSGVQRGYGNVIILEHENFMMTVYGHNDTNIVKVGDEVTQGQIIGTVGATGNANGAHLHFEYRVRGVAINPRDFLIGLP